MTKCTICEQTLPGRYQRSRFCFSCFKQYEKDILNGAGWVAFLHNSARLNIKQDIRDRLTVARLKEQYETKE